MSKYFKRVAACGIISAVVWISGLANKKGLAEEFISVPLIQTIGIPVNRPMMQLLEGNVWNSMKHDLLEISDISAARAYLDNSMDKIQSTVNDILANKERMELYEPAFLQTFLGRFFISASVDDCFDEPRRIP